MNKKISRREALKRLVGGSLALLILPTAGTSLLTGCRPSRDGEMRRRKAEADASLLTGCDACHSCMPCPYGVDIPANLRRYDKAVAEGRLPDPARQSERLLRNDCRTYLRELDATPRLAQTDRCIGCHLCAGSCPKGIDIELTLRRIEAIEEVVRLEPYRG